MKNLFIATVILHFCNFLQQGKALKNIEGTWSLNTWKADSAGVESEHISWAFAQAFGVTGADFIFDKCESGETCNFYTISKPSSLSSTDTGSYSISSDGATLQWIQLILILTNSTNQLLKLVEKMIHKNGIQQQ